MTSAKRRQLLQAMGIGVAGVAVSALTLRSVDQADAEASAAPLGVLPSHGSWINTSPLSAAALAGKVVLVNFWTFSCINSLRPLPYVREWADKYRERGLVVLGVHTPEFAFEHELPRVRRAVIDQQILYPVVLDNAFIIWNAFGNNAWPAFYFVDAHGRVRHRAIGEGNYEESERLIQRLLSEAVGERVGDTIAAPLGQGVQAPPDWDHLGSPETYVGYGKAENFAGQPGLTADKLTSYSGSASLLLNHWALEGAWEVGREFAIAQAGAKLSFRFHARDLNLVLGRSTSTPVGYRVMLDGEPPVDHHGFDVDARGEGVIDQDRMYQLVRQHRAIADRTFEVTFLNAGARAYVFTFG